MNMKLCADDWIFFLLNS